MLLTKIYCISQLSEFAIKASMAPTNNAYKPYVVSDSSSYNFFDNTSIY